MEATANTENVQQQEETKWYVLRVVSGKERKVKEYLDKEISRGGWLWTDCDASIVFDTPAEERWNKALATLGLTPGVVWMQPVDE